MTTKPESSKSQPADASSRSKGEASIAIASLPGYLHFMFTFPPRNASPLEVRAWLSRWRLDVAHVVAKTYVALNHEKKEATFKREFGWFEKAVAKIEITGRQLRDADDMWLAKRFLEAGFDFDIASLMMKDIFLAKLMGESMDLDEETKCMTDESAQLQEETRKSLEERNKAKMERMELPKEQKELKQETKKLKQELRAKREERVRILKIHEEILDRKGEVSREQEAEWEKVLRRTAGEGKETRAVHEDATLPILSMPDRSPSQRTHRASSIESGSSSNIIPDTDFGNSDSDLEEASDSEAALPKTPSSTTKANCQQKLQRPRRRFQRTALTRTNVLLAFLMVLIFICCWVFIVTSRFTTIELFLGVAFWLGVGAKVLMLYLRDFSYASFHDGLNFTEKEAEELNVTSEANILCLGVLKSNRFCMDGKSERRNEHGRLMKPLGHRVWEDGYGRSKVYPRKR